MKRILLLSIAALLITLPAFAVATHPFTSPICAGVTQSRFVSSLSQVSPALSTRNAGEVAPSWVLTMKERLNYKVELNLRETTLVEATDILRKVFKVNIILTNDARMSGDEFDLSVSSMRGVLALKWCCRLAKADWTVTDEAILIYLESEVKKEEVEEPTLDEILDMIEEETYTPPDFIAPDDPFGKKQGSYY